VADAQLASRRALQAQEQELRFAQQAHTALERAQPQRAQQLEAEAQKVGGGRRKSGREEDSSRGRNACGVANRQH
jgi:hypothetical protein